MTRTARPLALEGGSSGAQAPAPAAMALTLNRAELLARVGGDEQLMREVMQMSLAELPKRVAAVNRAAGDGDAEQLRTAAHALKGMAGTLSARAVMETASELESFGRDRAMEAAWSAVRRLETEASKLLRALEGESVLDSRGPACSTGAGPD
jgi:two-component system, sensor histidine kinase and response regulator